MQFGFELAPEMIQEAAWSSVVLGSEEFSELRWSPAGAHVPLESLVGLVWTWQSTRYECFPKVRAPIRAPPLTGDKPSWIKKI